MKNVQSNTSVTAVVQQVKNNSTSWVGHNQGETKDRITGQTFVCPTEGKLDCIEVLSNHVTKKGTIDLTIHEFNPEGKIWGPVMANSKVEFTADTTGKWVAFPLTGLQLHKGKVYAFKLKSDDALIGIGEAASSANNKTDINGQEWVAVTDNTQGKYFSYLSLAFKVDMRA
ncbi:MAG TPA: hypothetical protein PLU85_12090 [Bacteroidia bacterium]|nr:hypothetical protein [Ferruginibacter sp.]HRB26717.1 hypothetical protein [Bacteroidia bacterium]